MSAFSGPTSTEVWMPIPDFPGYEASDQGRVRSVDRFIVDALGRRRLLHGQMLTPHLQGNKHYAVTLSPHRRQQVHRLVLMAFVGSPPPGTEGCHINDDPADNRPANLYWGTRSDNLNDMVRNGRHYWANQTHCANGHKFTPDNIYEQTSGGRGCRECRKINAARYRERMAGVPRPDCTFDGCDKRQRSKGLCVGHYRQQQLGKPLTPLRRSAAVVESMGAAA